MSPKQLPMDGLRPHEPKTLTKEFRPGMVPWNLSSRCGRIAATLAAWQPLSEAVRALRQLLAASDRGARYLSDNPSKGLRSVSSMQSMASLTCEVCRMFRASGISSTEMCLHSDDSGRWAQTSCSIPRKALVVESWKDAPGHAIYFEAPASLRSIYIYIYINIYIHII